MLPMDTEINHGQDARAVKTQHGQDARATSVIDW